MMAAPTINKRDRAIHLLFGIILAFAASVPIVALATVEGGGTGVAREYAEPKCTNAPSTAAKLTQGQQSAVRKVGNIIKNHLKPGPKGDIRGTVSDMVGNRIPKPGGGHWDHIQEMQNSLRGLRRHAGTLDGVANPAAQAARQQALDSIRMIEDAIKGAGL